MALDPASLAVQGFTTIATSFIQAKSAKEQKQLEEYLNSLSLKQKEELEIIMRAKQTEVERQKVLFQAIAVENNKKLINDTNRKRNISIAVAGALLVSLAIMIYLKRRK